jgi:hypothetical protein
LQHDLAGAITLEPFIGNGGALGSRRQQAAQRAGQCPGWASLARMETDAVGWQKRLTSGHTAQ